MFLVNNQIHSNPFRSLCIPHCKVYDGQTTELFALRQVKTMEALKTGFQRGEQQVHYPQYSKYCLISSLCHHLGTHIAISDTILGLHRTTIKKLSTGCEGAARWKHKALFQRTLGVFLLSSWIWYPLPKAGCHATVEDIQCSLLQNAGLCQLL